MRKIELSETNQHNLIEGKPKCRICFQESQPLKSLPCKCQGDLALVHEQCYMKWLVSSHSSCQIQNQGEICCQVCHGNMMYSCYATRTCKNKNEIEYRQMDSALALMVPLIFNSTFCYLIITTRNSILETMMGLILLAFCFLLLASVVKQFLVIFTKIQLHHLELSSNIKQTPQ